MLVSLPVAAVQASPITLNFSGMLLPGFVTASSSSGNGNWDNRAFSGSVSFDPATAAYDITNPEGTFHHSNDNYDVPHPYVPWMLTTLNLPDGVVVSGNDSAQFNSLIQVRVPGRGGNSVSGRV